METQTVEETSVIWKGVDRCITLTFKYLLGFLNRDGPSYPLGVGARREDDVIPYLAKDGYAYSVRVVLSRSMHERRSCMTIDRGNAK